MAEEIKQAKKVRKKPNKYLISILIVLVLTGVSLFLSLYSAGNGNFVDGGRLIGNAFKDCDIGWLLVMIAVVVLTYLIEGLILWIFCRLYTRKYYIHQGIANSMIGAFYSAVTPGASGGQIMQAYTMKKQGIEVSNAASIMVMWFILYQVTLIGFDVFAIIFEWGTIASITTLKVPGVQIGGWNGELPMMPLIIIGFLLNLFVIVLLFLMSYSHKFHNFVMHYGVGLLGKLKLLKNPDKTRENLRVQVENFKIELRRLQANIPVTILIALLFTVNLILRFSIPYFAGLSLHAYGLDNTFSLAKMMDASFKSAFHQMVTGLVPIPGAAGVSELFFSIMFQGFFVETQVMTSSGLIVSHSASANVAAAQIIWRVAT
nr:flippase-like domain-containing protein [Bacilli bacterium]